MHFVRSFLLLSVLLAIPASMACSDGETQAPLALSRAAVQPANGTRACLLEHLAVLAFALDAEVSYALGSCEGDTQPWLFRIPSDLKVNTARHVQALGATTDSVVRVGLDAVYFTVSSNLNGKPIDQLKSFAPASGSTSEVKAVYTATPGSWLVDVVPPTSTNPLVARVGTASTGTKGGSVQASYDLVWAPSTGGCDALTESIPASVATRERGFPRPNSQLRWNDTRIGWLTTEGDYRLVNRECKGPRPLATVSGVNALHLSTSPISGLWVVPEKGRDGVRAPSGEKITYVDNADFLLGVTAGGAFAKTFTDRSGKKTLRRIVLQKGEKAVNFASFPESEGAAFEIASSTLQVVDELIGARACWLSPHAAEYRLSCDRI